MLLRNSEMSAMRIQVNIDEILGVFHYNKPYEKLTMCFLDSELPIFIKDFEKIQKTSLNFLKIGFDVDVDSVRRNVILNILRNTSSFGKWEIKRLSLELLDLNQAIAILDYLDPEFVKKIEIQFHNSDRKVDMENLKFLVDWKRGSSLKLVLRMDTIFGDNLKSINKVFLSWSILNGIDLIYRSFESDSDPLKFFDVPFNFETMEHWSIIKFQPNSSFRFAPSVVKLTLSNEKSATVLGNPLILKRIIKKFGIFDIQRLRKTSPGIRACVDHLNPETFLEKYSIALQTNTAITAGLILNGYNQKWIQYKRSDISDNGFLPRVLSDFELNLKNQKACLRELRLNFSFREQPEVLEHRKDSEETSEKFKAIITENHLLTSEFLSRFQKILENRSDVLKVKKLALMSVHSSEIMRILPFVDSKFLTILDIRDPCLYYCMDYNRHNYPESLKIPFDLEEIAKTEQWKSARELDIKSVPISTPIQKMNLTNFSRIYMTNVQTINPEDVAYLKENLSSPSSNLNRFIISFKEFPNRGSLYDYIGFPSRIYSEARKVWYYRMQDSKDYLEIDLSRSTIYFERVRDRRYVVE